GELGQFVIAHSDPARLEEAHELRRRFPPEKATGRGVWAAIKSGTTQTFEVNEEILRSANLEPELADALTRLRIRSSVVVPLRARGKNLGAVTLVWTEHDPARVPVDIAMAEEFAAQAGLALDNAR